MAAQRKLFLGARLKRLRRERGLNQSQMALAVSGDHQPNGAVITAKRGAFAS